MFAKPPAAKLKNLVKKLVSLRIAKEAVWAAVGQILSALAFLSSVRIMTELLSPVEFGRLSLMLGLAALALGLVANPRLQGLIRYYNEWKGSDNLPTLRRTGESLIFNTVMMMSAIITLGWLAISHWFGGNWLDGVLVSAILLIDCLRSFELALLNAARRQCSAAILTCADAWSRPAMAIAIMSLAGQDANATIALTSYAAGSGLTLLLMRIGITPEGKEFAKGPEFAVSTARARIDADLAHSIRNYSLPLLPLALFGWLSGVGDRYFIAGFLNLHDAGLYGAIYGLASRPFLMLSGIIELTLRPVLYEAIALRNSVLVKRSKAALALTTGVGGLLGVLCFALFSEVIGRLLLAAEYHPAIGLMPWVALGYALYGLSNVFSRLCYAFDDTRAVLILTAAGTVAGFAVLVPALQLGGLVGAALAVPVQFAVELALSTIMARRAESRFKHTVWDVNPSYRT